MPNASSNSHFSAFPHPVYCTYFECLQLLQYLFFIFIVHFFFLLLPGIECRLFLGSYPALNAGLSSSARHAATSAICRFCSSDKP